MAKYFVEVRRAVEKELRALPKKDADALLAAMRALGDEPRPFGCLKMSGEFEGKYRIRVGTFRILYEIYDGRLVVVVVRVSDRKEAYR